MGFKSVYQSLIDVFPQVDMRILKAVAIENSKDADAAVEVVLTEILPFLPELSQNSTPAPPQVSSSSGFSDEGKVEQESNLLRRRVRSDMNVGSSGMSSISKQDCDRADAPQPDSTPIGTPLSQHVEPSHDVQECDKTDTRQADSTCTDVSLNQPSESFYDADAAQSQLNTEIEELILFGAPHCEEGNLQAGSSQNMEVPSNSTVQDSIQSYANGDIEAPSLLAEVPYINDVVAQEEVLQVSSISLIAENGGSSASFTSHHSEQEVVDDRVGDGFFYVDTHGNHLQAKASSNGSVSEVEINVGKQPLDSAEDGKCSESPCPITDNCENVKSSYDDKIELLEQMIEAAKDNKRTLFSAMELVMNTMRQVELEEKVAEQAKEEAARGGFDILTKVEEIKQMLTLAKQANDMHAGEVYGEKAILATEARELQGRLLSLAEDRDNALSILDEMNRVLEARLAAAQEMRMAAEWEKQEKEESALNALAEQQAILGKVVQESKILQKEAEENSKLREFLVERGRVVDTLQGEISVICQDVKLLKEKFDNNLPLSKSISSSHTSCILASSGSSTRSVTPDLVPGIVSKSSKETSPACSVNGLSPKDRHEDQRATDASKELIDDEWDFFDA